MTQLGLYYVVFGDTPETQWCECIKCIFKAVLIPKQILLSKQITTLPKTDLLLIHKFNKCHITMVRLGYVRFIVVK